MSNFHILPINDMREHEETSECWCDPDYDMELGVWIHKSLDGCENAAIEANQKKGYSRHPSALWSWTY